MTTEKLPDPNSRDSQPATSPLGCLIHLFCNLIGYGFLFISAGTIIKYKGLYFPFVDLIFWLIALSIIITRFIDIRFFQGETIDNEPATMSHFWKYLMAVLGLAVFLWTCAHLLAYAGIRI